MATTMTNNTVAIALTGAPDLALTVTLVVFVILTAILATFIILLFAWKRFRDFFFSDKTKKERAPRKAATAHKDRAQKKKKQSRATARTATPAQKRVQSSYYDDGVPTVPLDGAGETAPAPASPKKQAKRSDDTLDKIPTVVIGAQSANKPQTPAAKSRTGKNTTDDRGADKRPRKDGK